MGLTTHTAPSNRQHTSISQEPFPGGMVAVQLTAPQTELQGLAGKAPPAPALPVRRRREGRALICTGPGGMQCQHIPRHQMALGLQAMALGAPSAPAASVFAGRGSADSWKHQLGQPQPEAAPRASPHCAHSWPRCAGVASCALARVAAAKQHHRTHPWHHPVPGLSPALHSPSQAVPAP